MGLITLAAFALWTACVCFIDVQPIGPLGSKVGFASLNAYLHKLTGVHMALYMLTDWLGLVPLGFIAGFALLGVIQWFKRRNIFKVDKSLFILGGFYIVVFAAYLLFEKFAVNYRPVLINSNLEASYPSSTTLLVLSVMPSAVLQLKNRIKNRKIYAFIASAVSVYVLFMVIGRLISGVHWFSDIVGGILLSAGLVNLYSFTVKMLNKKSVP